MPWSYRANAISFFLLTAVVAALAVGYAESSPVWMLALLAVGAVFGAVATLLWRGVAWAAPLGLGLTAYAAVAWGQSSIALGVCTSAEPWGSTFITCAALCAGCVAAFGLLWFIPRSMSLRHAASVALAGAALTPSVTFALAPGQETSVAIAMLGGAALLLAGALGLARGRTWGLLLNFVGAAVISVGAAFAPWLGQLPGGHPWLAQAGSLLVNVIGVSAATLALLSSSLYAGPILRFLVGGGSSTPKQG